MANILSQNEIDELLSALTSGSDAGVSAEEIEETQEVRPYDFRTANKFSKDQMRTLHFIHETLANRLSTYLSGTLRAVCEVEVISIEEQSFSEFSNSMPSPVIVAIVNMPPLQSSLLLEISPAISYELFSRLLGGSGQYHDTDKMFTEIELSIMELTVRDMLAFLSEAWEKICRVNASLDRIETSAQYSQIVSANEPIAIITMNVQIGDTSDIINLCIPHMAIQPVEKQLVRQTWYNEVGKSDANKELLGKGLSNIYLQLYAVFNDTDATVKDVLNTQVGDVIRINHKINNQITVKVEHIPKFKGFVGMHGSNYAVRVSDILRGEKHNEYADISE